MSVHSTPGWQLPSSHPGISKGNSRIINCMRISEAISSWVYVMLESSILLSFTHFCAFFVCFTNTQNFKSRSAWFVQSFYLVHTSLLAIHCDRYTAQKLGHSPRERRIHMLESNRLRNDPPGTLHKDKLVHLVKKKGNWNWGGTFLTAFVGFVSSVLRVGPVDSWLFWTQDRLQITLPVVSGHWPEQLADPSMVVVLPGGHGSHWVCLVLGWWKPAGHGRQSLSSAEK